MKKNIKKKINDIDQMLIDLNIDEYSEEALTEINPKIDINQLDVVDVLNNILN